LNDCASFATSSVLDASKRAELEPSLPLRCEIGHAIERGR
jgi:hypothetical protein